MKLRRKAIYQYKTNYQQAAEVFAADVVENVRKIKETNPIVNPENIRPRKIAPKPTQQELLFNMYDCVR